MSSLYLTDRAKADLAGGPVTSLRFVLGSAIGYTPGPTSTGIQGSQVLTGQASDPVPVAHNLYRYTLSLSAADDFEFGEIALLYPDNGLFGLSVFVQSAKKTSSGGDFDGVGGTIEVFVTTTGVAEVNLNAGFQLGRLDDVDNLPLTQDARYQMYMVADPKEPRVAMQAYRQSYLWGFSNYGLFERANVVSATLTSITLDGRYFMDQYDIAQVSSGSMSSAVRKISGSTVGDLNTVINFVRPLTSAPNPGTQVFLFRANSTGTQTSSGGGTVNPEEFVRRDGSKSMLGVLSFGNHRLSALADPQFDTDGVNRRTSEATRWFRRQVVNPATGTVVLNLNNYDQFLLTLTGNVQIAFTGGVPGQRVMLMLKQDAVGGRSVTLPATVRTSTSAGGMYQASPAANAVDILGLVPEPVDNRQYLVSVLRNFN